MLVDRTVPKDNVSPLLVWFVSRDDDRGTILLEKSIFWSEPMALALRKFRCVRIDIESVTNADLRKAYGATPCFVVIDPHGNEIGKISGEATRKRSGMERLIADAWSRLFEMPLNDFRKKMRGNLDRRDKIVAITEVTRIRLARLACKPDLIKLKTLQARAAALKEEQAEIARDEDEILACCALKKEYRSSD
jgi:hypothetical protein